MDNDNFDSLVDKATDSLITIWESHGYITGKVTLEDAMISLNDILAKWFRENLRDSESA